MAEEITVCGITVPLPIRIRSCSPTTGSPRGTWPGTTPTSPPDAALAAGPADHHGPLPRRPRRQRFFQKNAPAYFPDWIRRVEVAKEGGTVEHAICDQPATLVYLANQACIEIHAFTSRADKLDVPDQMVFDFDPPPTSGSRTSGVPRCGPRPAGR